MSPRLPKTERPWQVDPGHIHDVPGPPPMPDHQEAPDVGVPAHEVEVIHVTEDAREPHGDPAPVPDPAEVEVPSALAQEIRRAMKRYPEKRSASIPALWAVQRRYGWCTPEGIVQAAAVMGVTPAFLQGVASFYDLFHLEPQGEHQVLVCTNISCWLRGADELLAAFRDAASAPKEPNPKAPQTGGSAGEAEQPPDGVFVRGFECLGACDIAPMASIDERFYGPLEGDDAADAIEQLRSGEDVLPSKRLEDRPIAGDARAPADERLTKHPINKPTRPRPKSDSRKTR